MDKPDFLLPITVGSSAPCTTPDDSISEAENFGHAFSHTVKKVSITETLLSTNSGQIPTQSNSQQENDSNELGIEISNATSLADKRKLQCTQWHSRFKQSQHFTRHMRIHTGEKPFKCELCDYRCSVKGSLTSHIRTHTGEKPFKCELCDYRCSVKGSLTSHIRTHHTGEKPFKCELCDYRCSVKYSLTRHIRIHTGKKPF